MALYYIFNFFYYIITFDECPRYMLNNQFLRFKSAIRWHVDFKRFKWITNWISWTLIKQNHILATSQQKKSMQNHKMASKLNWWSTISSLGALCSGEWIDEMMTWLYWNEQPTGSHGLWSSKTLNPTLINKITFVDYLSLHVEQLIPWAHWVEANNHNKWTWPH